MHCQVLSHKINILLKALFHFFDLYGFFRASKAAFGRSLVFTHAIIALGIKIRDKILKDDPEGTGH